MNEKFREYLQSIGIGIESPFYTRVSDIIDFSQTHLLPDSENILDIFISEYINSDSKRIYEGLFLFSEQYFIEANRFITEDRVEIVPYRRNIRQFGISKSNFDFRSSVRASRMTVDFDFHTKKGAYLKATDKNCDHLVKIFNRFIQPNLVKEEDYYASGRLQE